MFRKKISAGSFDDVRRQGPIYFCPVCCENKDYFRIQNWTRCAIVAVRDYKVVCRSMRYPTERGRWFYLETVTFYFDFNPQTVEHRYFSQDSSAIKSNDNITVKNIVR